MRLAELGHRVLHKHSLLLGNVALARLLEPLLECGGDELAHPLAAVAVLRKLARHLLEARRVELLQSRLHPHRMGRVELEHRVGLHVLHERLYEH